VALRLREAPFGGWGTNASLALRRAAAGVGAGGIANEWAARAVPSNRRMGVIGLEGIFGKDRCKTVK
jgi:hypothetical protein